MEMQLIWRQTPKAITQIPLSAVINEISGNDEWTPESIETFLLTEKKLLHIPGVYYHLWRDGLH
ncbi:MAG: hypothetical protein GY757_21715 [bacterium]|nr:hypothetical protein [bacterium]